VVSALGCARFLRPVLAARESAALRAQLAAIEPLERRNAWLAVLDGAVDEAAWQQRLAVPVARLEKALTGADWLAGPAYSLADIDAYALVAPLRTLAPAVVNAVTTPHLAGWLARIDERPAVRAALALSRSGQPEAAWVPGTEPSRWG
jgi:glutathione S-transferase